MTLVKTALVSYKWVVFLVIMTLVYISLRHKETIILMEQERMNETIREITPQVADVTKYDVILSSYLRGGSTLLGLVLGFRDDAFYMYEPLWKTSRWTYWRGNSTVCRADKPECREINADMDIPQDFADNQDRASLREDFTVVAYDRRLLNTGGRWSSSGSLVMAKKVLWKIYDCLFNNFERTVIGVPLTIKTGGPSWQKVLKCGTNPKLVKYCIHKYAPTQCRKSRHKVSKVLRLTTDNFESILQERKSLKVVHLFRDPRAIINSRFKTGWFPVNSSKEIFDNAESLCSKMLYDFKAGNVLKEKFRNRFRFIYYEDFSSDPKPKLRGLYRYLGMGLNSTRYRRVLQASVFRQSDRKKDTATWWRTSLDWDTVQQVQKICAEAMDAVGYVRFNTKAEYMNLTLNSVVVPYEDILVTNSTKS